MWTGISQTSCVANPLKVQSKKQQSSLGMCVIAAGALEARGKGHREMLMVAVKIGFDPSAMVGWTFNVFQMTSSWPS